MNVVFLVPHIPSDSLMDTSGNSLRVSLGLSAAAASFDGQLHLNNWYISGLLIIGLSSETLGNETYHSSCPDLIMSSARFEVT